MNYKTRRFVRTKRLGDKASAKLPAQSRIGLQSWRNENALTNIAWSYHDPLDDAIPVRDLICFYHERLDLTVDGVEVPRTRTPWCADRRA